MGNALQGGGDRGSGRGENDDGNIQGVGVPGFDAESHAFFGEIDQQQSAQADLLAGEPHEIGRGESVLAPGFEIPRDAAGSMAVRREGLGEVVDPAAVAVVFVVFDRKKDSHCRAYACGEPHDGVVVLVVHQAGKERPAPVGTRVRANTHQMICAARGGFEAAGPWKAGGVATGIWRPGGINIPPIGGGRGCGWAGAGECATLAGFQRSGSLRRCFPDES